ncbi:hypothetical protein ACHAQJ_005861 [Trichoderma viride]
MFWIEEFLPLLPARPRQFWQGRYQRARKSTSDQRLAAYNATQRAAAQYFADYTTTALEAWQLALRREQAARAVERAFVRGFAAL